MHIFCKLCQLKFLFISTGGEPQVWAQQWNGVLTLLCIGSYMCNVCRPHRQSFAGLDPRVKVAGGGKFHGKPNVSRRQEHFLELDDVGVFES